MVLLPKVLFNHQACLLPKRKRKIIQTIHENVLFQFKICTVGILGMKRFCFRIDFSEKPETVMFQHVMDSPLHFTFKKGYKPVLKLRYFEIQFLQRYVSLLMYYFVRFCIQLLNKWPQRN